MRLHRSSGILLHPTSLPSGRLGEDAFAFVDWLAAAGQSWWQVLPLGPPDEHGSPYKSPSAFAGWNGLLEDPGAPVAPDELEEYVEREAYWIADWATFNARTGKAGAGSDDRHRKRRLARTGKAGAGSDDRHRKRRLGGDAIADQVRFDREWRALRAYAAQRGVRLIGDLPIYVAPGSADHVSHPELFQEDAVAGVPPDEFTDEGQLWRNPLYDWRTLREQGYRWWIERFRRTFELVDLTRLDHFRGFVAYWSVPADAETAKDGSWRPGPGRELFDAARAELGDLPVIAEDLGVITRAVERLRDELGFPGMHVLQWAWSGDATSPHRFENHRENGVVYTGTHDNDTTRGWWDSLTGAERVETGLEGREPPWSLVELALASRAALAIVPAQDLLGLGSEARMNTPGSESGNWGWRLERGQLSDELADRLRGATRSAGRA